MIVKINQEKLLPIITARLVEAVQTHMDEQAKALGYDDIKSAVTYAEEPSVAKFQQEGQAFRAWRSQVWAHCYALLAEGGKPPTVEELIANLPPFQIEAT